MNCFCMNDRFYIPFQLTLLRYNLNCEDQLKQLYLSISQLIRGRKFTTSQIYCIVKIVPILGVYARSCIPEFLGVPLESQMAREMIFSIIPIIFQIREKLAFTKIGWFFDKPKVVNQSQSQKRKKKKQKVVGLCE